MIVIPRLLLAGTCVVLTALAGCGGGGGGDSALSGGGSGACGESARKQWVLDVTREWYLFPETLPASVDLASYSSAEQLLDSLTATARAQGKDRFFSYLTTRAAENSLFQEGQFVGFGFRTRTDDPNRPFVLDVYEGSPAARAGLLRGDEIVAVDEGSGYVAVSTSLTGGRTITDLLGAATAGVQRGLRVVHVDGTSAELRMTKETVTLDPVSDTFGVALLPLAGTTGVGYVNLRSYISTADAQLKSAFAQFPNQQYFIVDLRYNGGGLVDTAQLIDDLLAAARSTTDVQFRFVYRDSRSAQDSTVRFQPQAQSVAPVRIAFLTTEATASASEINVNVMKPWVEVAIVGSDTYGKPVGQIAFDLARCEDRLRLIAFKTVNSSGEGDYYDGLATTMRFACAADDTLQRPMNDPADPLTRAALHWIANGACDVPMTASAGAAAKAAAPRAGPYPRPLAPPPTEGWLPGLQ